MKKKILNSPYWMCPENLMGISIAVGVVFGVGIDNVGLGICLGVAIGAGMVEIQEKRKEKTEG